MLALRYAALLSIALWTGGMLVLGGIAAPSIFDTLAARNLPDSRVIAGAVFGEILRRFHFLSYACAAVFFVSLLLRAVLGPRPSHFGFRSAVFGIMLAATLYSGLVVSGQIDRARVAAGGAPSALAVDDPRRVEFGRLHGLSTILQLLPVAGGLALLFCETRDHA